MIEKEALNQEIISKNTLNKAGVDEMGSIMAEKIDVTNDLAVIQKRLDELKKAHQTAVDATQVLWNVRIDAMIDAGLSPKDVLGQIACNSGCCGCGCCCSDNSIGIDRNQYVINDLNQKVFDLKQEVSVLQEKIK